MDNLEKYCDATYICIALIIALIIFRFIIFQNVKVQMIQTQGQAQAQRKNWCAIALRIIAILAVICCIDRVFKLDLPQKVVKLGASFVSKVDSSQNVNPAPSATPKYDTDARNDEYIKGALTVQQLVILDEILTFEKRNGGRQISNPQLKAFSKNDLEVQAAYFRWRWCKGLMRSHDRVIYPDERN